jgi:hypothetical protein
LYCLNKEEVTSLVVEGLIRPVSLPVSLLKGKRPCFT